MTQRAGAQHDTEGMTRWCAELWPNDEFTAIVAEALRHDWPPGTQD